MKIQKLYMALCGMGFAVQMASAQQNMVLVDNNGELNAIRVSTVNYATFNVNDKLFTISNNRIEGIKTNLITATCTVGLSAESNVKTLSTIPEVGVCYSKYNKIPTIDDNCLSLGSELKSYTFSLSKLISGTTYYFCMYVKLAGGVFYGDVTKAKTLGTVPVDNSKTINGHKFIDLGLPSGLLWAKTNIGAEEPADDGNYYAWGETNSSSDWDSFTFKHYKWYAGSKLSKYNSTDRKVSLDQEDDAACVNWGYPCRIPASDEFAELADTSNCIWTWSAMTASDGSSICGYKVSSVKNDNSIFLPASGGARNGGLNGHDSYGRYWSSTLYSSNSYNAYCFYFYRREFYQEYIDRCVGYPIRPVAEP